MMSKSIAEIRAELSELGNHSHTSLAFQDDILRIIKRKAIVENALWKSVAVAVV
jgi:hypothetical protein